MFSSTRPHNKQLEFSKGHLRFLTHAKCAMLPQSRKITKTKKKVRGDDSYYEITAKCMKNTDREACKRYDQTLQQFFEGLS